MDGPIARLLPLDARQDTSNLPKDIMTKRKSKAKVHFAIRKITRKLFSHFPSWFQVEALWHPSTIAITVSMRLIDFQPRGLHACLFGGSLL
jgi:hypothetical protein